MLQPLTSTSGVSHRCDPGGARNALLLDEMVELMAPKLGLPNAEFGLDIFCPKGRRSPYWEDRDRLMRQARHWARG